MPEPGLQVKNSAKMAAGRSGDARRLLMFDDDSAGIGEMSLVSFQITVMLNLFQYLSQVAAKP